MKRGRPLERRTPLPRGGHPNPRSRKRQRLTEARRALTERLMAERGGRCERCGAPAVELHEPEKRSRNPLSWLDETRCRLSCRDCNEWAEREPAAATAEGWLLPGTYERNRREGRAA